MGHSRYTLEDIVTKAEALYEKEIRAKVEADNIGKYLVIDIETGDYAIDENEIVAMKQAAQQHPDGVFHILRVGYRTMGRIGASLTRAGA